MNNTDQRWLPLLLILASVALSWKFLAPRKDQSSIHLPAIKVTPAKLNLPQFVTKRPSALQPVAPQRERAINIPEPELKPKDPNDPRVPPSWSFGRADIVNPSDNQNLRLTLHLH